MSHVGLLEKEYMGKRATYTPEHAIGKLREVGSAQLGDGHGRSQHEGRGNIAHALPVAKIVREHASRPLKRAEMSINAAVILKGDCQQGRIAEVVT